VIKAKFQCWGVVKVNGSESVQLQAVTGDDEINKAWAAATPGGTLNMVISNPAAQGQITTGGTYLLTIEPA
jgi:hypothetical protein